VIVKDFTDEEEKGPIPFQQLAFSKRWRILCA